MLKVKQFNKSNFKEFSVLKQAYKTDDNGEFILDENGKKIKNGTTKGKFKMEYRIISSYEYRDIENIFDDGTGTIKEIDMPDLIKAVNEKVWIGWEGVADEHENLVEFDPDLIQYLPLDVQAELYSFYFQEIVTPQLSKFVELSKNLKSIQK